MKSRLVSTCSKTIYVALLVPMFSSTAQADNEDVIAMCARIATVGDRILCLENALRRSSPGISAPTPEPQVQQPPAEEASAVANVDNDIVSPSAETEPRASDIAPQVNENFGLKEKRPVEETTAMRVIVTSVRRSLRNKLIFETKDGHVWQQTDQRTARYEDAPFAAEIRPGSLGSFFLKPDSSSVSVRVRRDK